MQIEVNNITHIYGKGMPFETVALENISFEVACGEFVCIIGHTGSGKSTLIQHMNGLLRPDSGEILANGIDISKKGELQRALRRKIAMVFQYPEYQLFEETVLKDVCFGPHNMGCSSEECEAKAKKALKLVGICDEAKWEASPFSLSGGEKRRVAIAGVLAMEPEVLILDEPSSGLDPKGHRDILSLIERVRNERNISIVLVSHNMDDVARFADRVIVMDKGSLVMNGTPKEVFAQGATLRSLGLSQPQCMEFCSALKEAGIPLEGTPLRIEDAANAIAAAFRQSNLG